MLLLLACLFRFVGARVGGMGMGEPAIERKRNTRGGGERGRWREEAREVEDSHLLCHCRLRVRAHFTHETESP